MDDARLPSTMDSQDNDGSEDSFLDVVANVVGVLIILVMVVGAQAARSVIVANEVPPADSARTILEEASPVADIEGLRNQLDQATQTALKEQRQLVELRTQIVKVAHEASAYDQQRVELATHRALIEEDLERRKEQLDAQQQQEYETQRRLLETKIDLEKLMQEQMNLLAQPDPAVEVECVPTPLAQIVEGEAIHLRLSKGLVSVVPLNELLAEIQYNTEGWRRRLEDSNKVVETYGPLNGFRLKLTVVKESDSLPVTGPMVGQIPRTSLYPEAEFIPVSEAIGQNVERALLPDGTLTRLLNNHTGQKPAVVVWLYTDSFDEFRMLKRELWDRGFALATRPMKPGTQIGASPRGTRAAAQ